MRHFYLAAALVFSAQGFSGCAAGRNRLPSLVKSLQSPKPAVRLNAVRKLREMGRRAAPAASALAETLNDKDQTVREETAEALAGLGEAAVDPLRSALRDSRPKFRCRAAQTLGLAGTAAAPAAEDLVRALKDADPCVERAAGDSLARLGEASVPPLLDALRGGDWLLRRKAAETFGRLSRSSQRRAAEALAAQWEAGDLEARGLAFASLGKVGAGGMDVLARFLSHADPAVRDQAVASLGEVDAPPAELVPVLAAAFRDPRLYIRRKAAMAAGRVGVARPETAGLLEPLLQDVHPGVRRAAAEALGVMGKTAAGAVPALAAALRDPDGDVREEAAEALAKIQTTPALEALRAYRRGGR